LAEAEAWASHCRLEFLLLARRKVSGTAVQSVDLEVAWVPTSVLKNSVKGTSIYSEE
jgi:hypothetical protein